MRLKTNEYAITEESEKNQSLGTMKLRQYYSNYHQNNNNVDHERDSVFTLNLDFKDEQMGIDEKLKEFKIQRKKMMIQNMLTSSKFSLQERKFMYHQLLKD